MFKAITALRSLLVRAGQNGENEGVSGCSRGLRISLGRPPWDGRPAVAIHALMSLVTAGGYSDSGKKLGDIATRIASYVRVI